MVGCSEKITEADLLSRAQHSRAAGDSGAAIVWLKQALEKEPKNAEARYLMAATYADAGYLRSAQELLSIAVALGLDKAKSLPLTGRMLLLQEKYQQLLSELDAQELTPAARSEVMLLRGQAYLALGMPDEARNAFESAVPQREVDAMVGLARLAILQGDLDAANDRLAKAVALDPKSGEAWLVKGDLLRIGLRSEEALQAYKQSLTLQPRSIASLLSMASLHIGMGKYDQALELLNSARKLAPADVRVQFTDALLSFHQKRYEACRDALRRVFAVIPDHAPSILLSGDVSFVAGQLEQAQRAFSVYLAHFPANIHARRMLAATLLRNGQAQTAVLVLEPLLKNDTLDRELLILAGEAYLRTGQLDRARHYLQRAIDQDPKSPGARTAMGLIWLAQGDSQRASTELEAAVRLTSDDAQPEKLLVMALIAENSINRALEVVGTMERKRPNRADTHQLRGAIFLAQQEIAKARASFEQALGLQPTYLPAAAALAELDLRQNDFTAARGRMEAILKKDPTHLDTTLTIATLEASVGHRKEAADILLKTLVDHPTAVQAYLLLAQLDLDWGKTNEALSVAQQARRISPVDPQVLAVLGRAQLALGDNAAAIASFSRVVQALPTSVPALLSLGSAHSANGDDRAAAASIKRAAELNPSDLEASVALGAAYLKAKRFGDALDMARKIQKQHPDLAQGYALEGDVYLTRRDYRLAVDLYRKADRIQSTGTLRVRLYDAQRRANKATADSTPLVQWVETHADDIDTRLYLADVYLKDGQTPAAVAQYEALLRVAPNDYRVLNNMAWALAQMKDARALDYAYRAYQANPGDAAVADTLGWLLVERGKLYEGTILLQKAADKNPAVPDLRLHLAEAWARAGENKRARKELDDLIHSNKALDQREDVRRLVGRLAASGKGSGNAP